MARHKVYQPAISPSLISALYHEAKNQNLPMTKLIDRLLKDTLRHTEGFRRAAEDWPELAAETQRQGRLRLTGTEHQSTPHPDVITHIPTPLPKGNAA